MHAKKEMHETQNALDVKDINVIKGKCDIDHDVHKSCNH